MARFRTRARTVDLLGRQQIAGIPTAVHELFKNAHDAYANHVEVDVFDSDGLFVLRDDGVGMTRAEFEERWLVVGTESKVKNRRLPPPPVDTRKATRPILGEKGIGRLAIGIVGNPLLILSRAVRDGVVHPLMAAFLHWEVFALPGVDLDQIDVPIEEVGVGQPVDRELVQRLVARFRACVTELADRQQVEGETLAEILRDLDRFDFDPWEHEASLPGSDTLRLARGDGGTQFWVFPADSMIRADLDLDGGVSPMARQLQGFANTMTPAADPPILRIACRHHKSTTVIDDVVGPGRFFEPGEMLNADHYISGEVDAFGTFHGAVSVFGEAVKHTIVLPGRRRRTKCGAFEAHLAIIQGAKRETTLPDADWELFRQKADAFGGMYVYLDGIRVLPYGNPDFDWLHIEERRSKSASYYFFSHRRMCGAVLLSRRENGDLDEKAGREGFIRNVAYRDLRLVMENMLDQLAADFFRKDARFGERYEAAKAESRHRNEASAARERTRSERKKKLQGALTAFDTWVESGAPGAEAAELRESFEKQMEDVLSLTTDERRPGVLGLTRAAVDAVEELVGQHIVRRPRIGLTKALERQWERYHGRREQLEDEVFQPLRRELDRLVRDAIEIADVDIDVMEQLHENVAQDLKLASERSSDRNRALRDALAATIDRLGRWRTASFGSLQMGLREVESELGKLPILAEELTERRVAETRRIHVLVESFLTPATSLLEQLEALSPNPDASLAEQLAAVEQSQIELREQLDEELESAQLGMAIAVISHEFDHLVRDLRANIQGLGRWGEANPELRGLVSELRNGFEHLDGYLTLFTPLRRRLYRKRQLLKGREIEGYVLRLFGTRLEQCRIKFVATDAFRDLTFWGFPSTYYAVFVNLVDNALFWLRGVTGGRVELDTTAQSLVVRDNGPGVASDDLEWVFGRGHSSKPGGRGLGLTISRDLLRREGGELRAVPNAEGACFEIRLPTDALVSEE